MRPALPYLVAAIAVTITAIIGSKLTDLGPWYASLAKPGWKPPDAAFAPVWTTIFVLIAIAAGLGWNATAGRAARSRLAWLFLANLVLNGLWSLLFFRLHRPDWALAELVLLWLSILALAILLFRVSRLASALLLPYLVWVAFAGLVNFWIVRANGPFG